MSMTWGAGQAFSAPGWPTPAVALPSGGSTPVPIYVDVWPSAPQPTLRSPRPRPNTETAPQSVPQCSLRCKFTKKMIPGTSPGMTTGQVGKHCGWRNAHGWCCTALHCGTALRMAHYGGHQADGPPARGRWGGAPRGSCRLWRLRGRVYKYNRGKPSGRGKRVKILGCRIGKPAN